MDFSNTARQLSDIRKIDIVKFLHSNGIEPAKQTSHYYLYNSPLRNEQIPSFKVDLRRNSWYDFGLMKGGNFIDFAILYYNCSVGQLLEIMRGEMKMQLPVHDPSRMAVMEQPKIEILKELPLTSTALLSYMLSRRIDIQTAMRFTSQIHFAIGEKNFFAVGFRNRDGGYELRNQFMKLSSSPKAPTEIDFGAHEVKVVEGFFDFLSLLTLERSQHVEKFNYCVLNSVAMFERSIPFLAQHDKKLLYLDNDAGGRNCVLKALQIDDSYVDQSALYTNHNDLNEYLCNGGQFGDRKKSIHL